MRLPFFKAVFFFAGTLKGGIPRVLLTLQGYTEMLCDIPRVLLVLQWGGVLRCAACAVRGVEFFDGLGAFFG